MYCPECRSEYRAGVVRCVTCDVALIETLPELKPITVEEDTRAVGRSGESGLSQKVQMEGRTIDLSRCFVFEEAKEIQGLLEDEAVSTLLREVGLEFPDHRARFEVHVRPQDHAKADQLLHGHWRNLAAAEAGGDVAADDPERCPACGASVPLDVAECPECGLNVGIGGSDPAEDEEGAGAAAE